MECSCFRTLVSFKKDLILHYNYSDSRTYEPGNINDLDKIYRKVRVDIIDKHLSFLSKLFKSQRDFIEKI